MSHKKKNIQKAAAKLLFAGVLSFGAITIAAPAMAQLPTPPQGPPQGAPTPPPSPGEMLDKINIFKKNKKAKTDNRLDTKIDAPAPAVVPGNAPPAPPNPLDIFKKKKKGSSVLPPPPKAPGA